MPAQIAGTEVYVWALAKGLQANSFEVYVIVPNYNQDFDDEYEYDGVRVLRYAEPSIMDHLLLTSKRPPDGLPAFEKLIARLRPDVAHIHELTGCIAFGMHHLAILKRQGTRIFFTMHLASQSCFTGTLMYKGKTPCDGKIRIGRCTRCVLETRQLGLLMESALFGASVTLYLAGIDTGRTNSRPGTALSYPFIIERLRKQLHQVAAVCEKLVVLTDWYRDVLRINGIPANKLAVSKQALPAEVSTPACEEPKPEQPLKLVYIGRIDSVKGLHLLLQAIQLLPRHAITLHIYGKINDDAFYRHWKDATRQNNNVVWCGVISQQDVVSTLSRYDALVLPSVFSEMSPLVIQEAFAAGIPVIGSGVAGIKEQVVHQQNGLIFKFNDATALHQQLVYLLEDKTRLLHLRRSIVKPRPFSHIVREMISLYDAAPPQQ